MQDCRNIKVCELSNNSVSASCKGDGHPVSNPGRTNL
uniref:Uncharacterized protein n=1 Tax=Arundo donax TaxID=35708 RepID=A0A0A9BSM6_ARUDO